MATVSEPPALGVGHGAAVPHKLLGSAALPSVEAVLYSEFDVKLGPQLVHQNPEGFFTKDEFGEIDKYLISKPEFDGKVLTVRTERHRVVSCPVHITGDKYPRNYLLFNVAFVFAADANVASAEPIVRKLAESLRSLEVDSGYIIGDGKQQLEWVLREVREQLNRDGQADVTISPGNTLRLRMPPLREVQPLVAQHEVPVPLVDFSRAPVDRLDWAIAELLPHIDGVACAKAIALRSGVHVAIVLKALRCLAARRLVAIVPTFQFHSVYLATREVGRLLTDPELGIQCEVFTHFGQQPRLSAGALFELYCDLTPRHPYWTVADIVDRHDFVRLGVDARRFIYFGAIHGLIRKVDKHPIRETDKSLDDMDEADLQSLERVNESVPAHLLQGKHTVDEVCCEVEMGFRELIELLDIDPYANYYCR